MVDAANPVVSPAAARAAEIGRLLAAARCSVSETRREGVPGVLVDEALALLELGEAVLDARAGAVLGPSAGQGIEADKHGYSLTLSFPRPQTTPVQPPVSPGKSPPEGMLSACVPLGVRAKGEGSSQAVRAIAKAESITMIRMFISSEVESVIVEGVSSIGATPYSWTRSAW